MNGANSLKCGTGRMEQFNMSDIQMCEHVEERDWANRAWRLPQPTQKFVSFSSFHGRKKGCRDKAVMDEQTVSSLKGNEIKSWWSYMYFSTFG